MRSRPGRKLGKDVDRGRAEGKNGSLKVSRLHERLCGLPGQATYLAHGLVGYALRANDPSGLHVERRRAAGTDRLDGRATDGGRVEGRRRT